uniref:Reverse transcriptase domain-containing protein n=1 Tax=Anolis carolinensis TaxID=28377 RepID=A0A803SYX8_ANOCA
MGDLTILALNINGMADLKIYRMLKMAKECRINVIMLSETHKKRGRDKLIKDKTWNRIYESRGTGNSQGVAILINENVPFQELDVQRDREVFVKGKINQVKITLAVIYAPNRNTKQYILNTKKKLDNYAEGTLIWAGDFNLDLTKKNKKAINVNKLNMVDVHANQSIRDTFYSARHNKFSCIDYILLNKASIAQIKKVERKPIFLSDHSPLIATLGLSNEISQRIWRYNSVVTGKDEYKLKLQEEIKEYYRINDNGELSKTVVWDSFKSVLRGQCFSIESYIRKSWREKREKCIKEIESIQEQLRITRRRNINSILRQKKKELELMDEVQWNKMRQSVRQRINGWGTKSMKQMVRYLKRRKEKSCITKLKDKNGLVKDGRKELEEIMRDFYRELYQKEQVNNEEIKIGNKVNEEDKIMLNDEITQEEVIQVIKGLKQYKAPGIDGYTAEFYKTFMHELVPYMAEMFNEVYMRGIVPETWKLSEIIPVLKPDRQPELPESYRPISLVNQDYKIFMKIIANRLEIILPKIIGEDQYGFVKGRSISEPIRNVVNAISHATKTKRKLSILKLDVYKAFDKVNHEYLYRLCKELNLGNNFCEMIKNVYRENTACIRVNGQRTENIQIENGTKQGCPLSPMLFALVIEPLAYKIRMDETWEGYKIGRKEELRLNLYVDDAIILTQRPREMIKSMKIILSEFKKVSGLSVNMEKSEILFINTPPKEQLEIRKESGLKLGIKKMKYLGIWIFKTLDKTIDGNYRMAWKRMLKQMSRWKNKNLRQMSRIRALKILIIPKMMYLFQALPGIPPMAKLKEWDRKLNYWVEGGKRPRVRKKLIIAKEMKGGWGLSMPRAI